MDIQSSLMVAGSTVDFWFHKAVITVLLYYLYRFLVLFEHTIEDTVREDIRLKGVKHDKTRAENEGEDWDKLLRKPEHKP